MVSDNYSSFEELSDSTLTSSQISLKSASNEEPLTVSQLNASVRKLLEKGFPNPIWVIGEISKPTYKESSGHLYFRLKDDTAEVDAVFFRWGTYAKKLPLEAGVKWQCYCNVTMFEQAGKYQLRVTEVKKAGKGDLLAQFMRIKEELINAGHIHLDNAGMVDYSRRRRIPRFVNTVGIVSSPGTAGLKDLLLTISNRASWMNVIIFPASVQGAKAASEIIAAINLAQKHPEVEVIVIARGGGSVEDLWCFNDKDLAIAVADCKKPVISAIGHEVDFTICDFVADCRAATPTYAATILAQITTSDYQSHLIGTSERLPLVLYRSLLNKEQHLDYTYDRLARHGLHKSLDDFNQKLLENEKRIIFNLKRAYETANNSVSRTFTATSLNAVKRYFNKSGDKLGLLQSNLIRNIQLQEQNYVKRVELSNALLSSNDPKRPVKRGFAIVRNAKNQIVRDQDSAPPGTQLSIEIAKGNLTAEVIDPTTGSISGANYKDKKVSKSNKNKEKQNDEAKTLFE